MQSKESMRSVIGLINKNKSIPALSLVKPSPETAAAISKLIRPREKRLYGQNDQSTYSHLAQSSIGSISESIKERSTDTENMLQLFPDMELAAQILISSIISPKDMMNSEILYSVTDKFLSSEITSSIIDIIRLHCDTEYSIRKKLPEILRDVLFETGSYPIAVIPESSLDDLINSKSVVTTESLTGSGLIDDKNNVRSKGILGNPNEKPKTGRVGLESFAVFSEPSTPFNETVSFGSSNENLIDKLLVTDNFEILKLPKVIQANNKNKVRNKIHHRTFSIENQNNTKLNEVELEKIIYKVNQSTTRNFVTLKTADSASRKSVGRPLVMKLPSESCIPVFIPGNEKEHIGYFVLIDNEGNPVSKNSNTEQNETLGMRINDQSSSMSSMLLQRAQQNLVGFNEGNKLTIDQATKIYSEIVESDLLNRLKNGIYGSNVEIGRTDEIYRIMMARTFANQYTRLVYIPSELLVYFAYKYHHNGVGKSLLDDMRVINSLRAMTMFARVMASLKNSIGVTEVRLKLDERDPDPERTIEQSIHEIMKTRQQYFPLGINSPVDLVDWVQRSGFEFTFEGHPKIPDMNFEFNQKGANHVQPDTDLDDGLKKSSIMAVGLSPETVDNGFASEFATTVVSNNILLSKRVVQIQDVFTEHLTSFVRMLIDNDMIIREEISGILEENKEALTKYLSEEEKALFSKESNHFFDYLIDQFRDMLIVDLPKPTTTTLTNQMESFDQYVEALDKALDAWVSGDFMNSEVAGELGNNIDTIRAVVRSYYIRNWMAENNVLPELADLTMLDDEGKPKIDLFDVQKNHITGLMRSSVRFLSNMQDMVQASNKDLEGMNIEESDYSDSSDSDSSSEETSSSDFSSDDMSGLDDLGLGDDSLTEEETTGEESAEEPVEKEEPKEESSSEGDETK